MMPPVDITTEGSKLVVHSPYNTFFAKKARRLGGDFNPYHKAWFFDTRDTDRVRALCMDLYGCDGLTADVVTLRIKWNRMEYTDQAPLTVGGRPLATAFGRDSGVRHEPGIVVLAGRFRSGGSRVNWDTRADEGTEVLVRDFPRARAEALIAAQQENDTRTYSIEPEAEPVDVEALTEERKKLVARIAEIDALLPAQYNG